MKNDFQRDILRKKKTVKKEINTRKISSFEKKKTFHRKITLISVGYEKILVDHLFSTKEI